TSLRGDGQRLLRGRGCFVDVTRAEASLAEQCQHRRLLHQESPRRDLVSGRSHQSDALLDPPGQEIDPTQEASGLRAQQLEVRLASNAAGALERGGRSIEVSLDEANVAEPDAGGGEAVGILEAAGQAPRPAPRGDALVELPQLRKTAGKPGEADRLMGVPRGD